MKIIRILYIQFILIGVLSFQSCSVVENVNLFSDKDDVALGQELDKEIKSNPKEYPIYTKNPAIKTYIANNIVSDILKSPSIKKRDIYAYTLEIIENDSVLNAFCAPGGYIYVYTGLLKYLDSESALAGVLAHEIGHAEHRHATERMTKAYGAEFLLSLVLGENPSQVSVIAANLFTGLGFLANSRADEDESDESAINYLLNTKFYPGGVKFFFEKMRDDGLISGGGKVATFLSTHPDPLARIKSAEDRLRALNIPIKDYKSNDSDMRKNEYRDNIKSKL